MTLKNKKIVIAGGSGFIGEEMIRYWGKNNDLVILTRQLPTAKNNRNDYTSLSAAELVRVSFKKWDGKKVEEWSASLNGADLLINLAGKSVNCRYTGSNKKEILESRTSAVAALGQAIQQCSSPPALWINASSATIYRHALDHPQDEFNGETHDGFSVQVCKAWEKSFYSQDTPHTRKIALRMAITLGRGGVLIPYFNLLKFGLGGQQGNGKQMYSWIHIKDTCRMIEWITDHPQLEGTYNCSSPAPVPNHVFMKTLRKLTGKKFGLPSPKWMLELGGFFIGTETELVLKSRWVIPTRIQQTGFQFQYADIESALADIIQHVPAKQYQLF